VSETKKIAAPSATMVLAVVIPVIMFGGIGIAQQAGWWQTERGTATPATIQTGDFAGIYDPADIRGSSTFGEIETYFALPADLIAQAFGIRTENPAGVTAKTVDELYGEVEGISGQTLDVGTDSVKLFVARMSGIPFEADEITGMPESAIDTILTLGAGMSDEERTALLASAVADRSQEFEILAAAEEEDHETTTTTGGTATLAWTGQTTFGQVLAAGLSQEQIESVLGIPMGGRTEVVRTFAEANGLSYSTIRTEIDALLGQQ